MCCVWLCCVELCCVAQKNRPNLSHYQNSFVSIFIGGFLPFYKAF